MTTAELAERHPKNVAMMLHYLGELHYWKLLTQTAMGVFEATVAASVFLTGVADSRLVLAP